MVIVMSKDTTGAIVDNILKLSMGAGLLATALAAPNAVQIFDKPLQKALNTFDERARQRELRRILAYMKHRRLISEDYEHGLTISAKGLRRLQKREFNKLAIARPELWDKQWRLVIFDIPEPRKAGRDALSYKLRQLGFVPLQRSVWIHPFPCRDEITLVCTTYGIARYVTFLETSFIDNQAALKLRFKNLLST